jgi:hypothetical protein
MSSVFFAVFRRYRSTTVSIGGDKTGLASRMVTIAVLILLPIIYFALVLFAGYSLVSGDGVMQILGDRFLIGKMIAAGQMPLWNPYILAGTPLLASLHPGVLYPPNWIFAIFSLLTAINLVVITTSHLALIGTYLYGRRIGLTRLGGIIAGIVFTFGGFMMAHIGDSPLISSAAWLPWILLAIESLYLKVSWRWISLGAIFLTLQFFAGDPQISLYTILVGGGYVLFSWAVRGGEESSPRFLISAVAMFVCGTLLSMIQLLPAFELFSQADRANISYESFSSSSFPPGRMLSFIIPYFPGSQTAGSPQTINQLGPPSIELCGYLGLLTLWLALLALFVRRGNKLARFWTGTALLSLLLALGDYLPLGLNHMFYNTPLFGLFSVPARNLYQFTFSISMLAGLGIGLIERRNFFCAVLLVSILFVDLAIFGLVFNWERRQSFVAVNARLQDSPSVQFIKSREADTTAFRIISHSFMPFGKNYDLLNFPNLSIARGLRSVNGIEELRLPRQMVVAGGIGANGLLSDVNIFNSGNQGLNLLNVKYLLSERGPLDDLSPKFEIEGIRFNQEPIYLKMTPGSHLEITVPGVKATELALVTTMADSVRITDETPIAQVKLHAKDGRVLTQEIRAGRDTGEWAYDYVEILPQMKHRRPPIAQSLPAKGFSAYQYLARLPFDSAEIERIELDYVLPYATLIISRVSLHDAATGASTPISSLDFSTQQWRSVAQFGNVGVYQNQKWLPRAWFVKCATVATSSEVLQIIKSGIMPDGSPFNPSETALLEREDFGLREVILPAIGDPADSTVSFSRSEPNRIELHTRNSQPGFLVLSEAYYRGWDAWVDGQRTPVERVNYTLRGIAVPPGEHRIEFVFRAPTFRDGAIYSLLGALLLMAGTLVSRMGTGRLWHLVPPRLRSSDEAERVRTLIPQRALTLIRSKALIIIAVLGLIFYGYLLISRASYSVGGSDSSGYASLGRSIIQGNVVRSVTELAQFNLPNDYGIIFIPLAYLPGQRPGTMIPVYPVGLPLHFAVAALIFGWDVGPFLIGPLAATISLILIYLIGLELGLSRKLSFIAGVILAVNPTVIIMAVQPMSDVPAMCWSLAAILASLRSRKNLKWAVLAGFAFGVAILIRPTNILLLIPILLSLRLTPKVLLYFGLGGVPATAVLFIYNTIAFGSPFRSGYGAWGIFQGFKLHYFPPRFKYYTYWLAVTMSPLLLLGWLGVAINRDISWRNRALLLTWFGAFLLLYSFYYDYQIWWYTRFLLPGIPALILGFLLTARYAAKVLKKYVDQDNQIKVGRIAAAFLFIVVIGFAIHHIKLFKLFEVGHKQMIHKESCLWADRMVPQHALIVSMEMSGALRYYTDRKILRYDYVDPPHWPVLKNRAAEQGYSFYALLMDHEITPAKERLPGKWTHLGTFQYYMSLWQVELVETSQ